MVKMRLLQFLPLLFANPFGGSYKVSVCLCVLRVGFV